MFITWKNEVIRPAYGELWRIKTLKIFGIPIFRIKIDIR